MSHDMYSADEAMVQFRIRMQQLDGELRSVDAGLARQNFLTLADTVREVLRKTRTLLDSNLNVLFGHQPPRVAENLHKHLEYAQSHLDKALGEEYEFEIIFKRLHMATTLVEYVIQGVDRAAEEAQRTGKREALA